MTPAPYTPGQPVARIAFTDAAGRRQERINDLTVESVRLEVCTSIPSYWRITASGRAGRFEGGAQFFEASRPT